MFSDRIKKIKPFIVMEVLEKAIAMEKQGIDVVHFEIGEPDFDTPHNVINSCYNDMKAGATHYTHSLGNLDLRTALSDYKIRTRGTEFNPKTNFMITGGTSPAFLNIMSTLIDPGDEVLISDPGYPCYANFVSFFGGKPVYIPIYESDDFNLRVDLVKEKISPKTKMIILNSPSNPTGQIIPDSTLSDLVDLLVNKNIWIISDEIYAELTYSGKIAPSLSDKKYQKIHDHLIVLDGFSKYWAMTGWRLGYIIAPTNLINAMTPIQQNFMICAPSISQSAAIHALKCEKETKEMLNLYKIRRDYIVGELNSIKKLKCIEPKGAFYAFCNIKSLGISSLEFSTQLLEKANVATTPGISFGPNGEGFVRLSYPIKMENIEKGITRIKNFINDNY